MDYFRDANTRSRRRIVGSAVLVGCLLQSLCDAQSNDETTSATVQAQVVKPAVRSLTRLVQLPGSLTPSEQAALFAKVSGYVERVNVEIGDRVSAGQALLTLDVPEMTAEIAQADAEVAVHQAMVTAAEAKTREFFFAEESARAEIQQYRAQSELDMVNLQRKQELFAAKAIPRQALDEAVTASSVSQSRTQVAVTKARSIGAQRGVVEAEVAVAQAQAKAAQARLDRLLTLSKYSIVMAPFDGVITRRLVDPGDFVRSGAASTDMPLFEIMKTDKLRVVMAVAEADAAMVSAGTRVSLQFVSLGGAPVQSLVSRTAGVIQSETRTMRVEVDLDNSDGRLAPGMYVAATLTLESKAQATLIPSKAIRTAGADTVVFVVDQGLARSAPITIGYDDGIWAEVLSGLNGTEQVITATSGAIIPGSRVRAIQTGS